MFKHASGAPWVLAATLPGFLALPGCMPGQLSLSKAAAEPDRGAEIALTVRGDTYELHRRYSSEWHGDPLLISRGSLPDGCTVARFVLDDAGTALPVAMPVNPVQIAATEPPLPATDADPCTLRVSYGSFTGPPTREGLVVTSSGGVVAYAARERGKPGYYALVPFEAVAEIWLFSVAVLTSPVTVPVGMAMSSSEKKKQAEFEAALPPEVLACWQATKALVQGGCMGESGQVFAGFHWNAAGPNHYTTRCDPVVGDELPCKGEIVQVTLRGGRVSFPPSFESTDAEIDCDLAAGQVTATTLRLRE
jgi:hypothetical protein